MGQEEHCSRKGLSQSKPMGWPVLWLIPEPLLTLGEPIFTLSEACLVMYVPKAVTAAPTGMFACGACMSGSLKDIRYVVPPLLIAALTSESHCEVCVGSASKSVGT